MDESSVKLSKEPGKVPTANDLLGFRFGWNARDKVFYGLAVDGAGAFSVVPIGGAVNGTPQESGSFKGTCDTHTDPGTPTADEWWSATMVGVYGYFGGVEVTTIDEVFNYLKWSQSSGTWSVQTVPVNMSVVQIPRVIDGIWDLGVNANLELSVQAFAVKKGSNPGYPYFYLGSSVPTFHGRLNLDGDLHTTKLWAGAINLRGGTALKFVATDADNNLISVDAPGGTTPTDNILEWNAGSSAYKAYAVKKDSDPGYPYFYLTGGSPSFGDNTLYLDGRITAYTLNSYMGTQTSALAGALLQFARTGSYTSQVELASSYMQMYGKNWAGTTYIPVYIGYVSAENIKIDTAATLFSINMTKTRFVKGTALKFLRLDANKDVVYEDNVETIKLHVNNVAAGSTIFIDPKSAYAYRISSVWIQTVGGTSNVVFYKNATAYNTVNIGTGGSEITSVSIIPTTLAADDVFKVVVEQSVTSVTIRVKLLRILS